MRPLHLRRVAPVAAAPFLVAAAVAFAAPSSSSPPTISGEPQYDTPLTCNPGTWVGAVAFSYDWVEGRSYVAATGQVFTPKAANLDRTYVCRVTATDAAGQTATASSAPVKIAHQKMTVRLSLRSTSANRLRVVATVGPKKALRASSGRKASFTLYRSLGKKRYAQITIPPRTVPSNGKLKFTVKKVPSGKRTFYVQVSAADRSLYDTREVTRKVTIKRQKKSKKKR